jgi:hypothetical protein
MLDMANRVVSIDLEIHEVGAGMLCYGHAERVVVPKGWTLEDRREHEPRLFDVGAPQERLPSNLRSDGGETDDSDDGAADDEAPAARRRERRRRALLRPEPTPAGQLALDGYDLPSEYRQGAKSPQRAAGKTGEPGDDDDDLHADRAQNPLLARAFDLTKGRRVPAYLTDDQPSPQPHLED